MTKRQRKNDCNGRRKKEGKCMKIKEMIEQKISVITRFHERNRTKKDCISQENDFVEFVYCRGDIGLQILITFIGKQQADKVNYINIIV